MSRGIRAGAAAGAVMLALIVAACTSSSSSSAPSVTAAASAHTVSYSRVVDLSHVISPQMPLWPGDPHVVFKVVATMDKDGYYLRSFTIGEHSATHMNAPNSFIAGNTQAITSYPAEQRVVPAVVIDVREKVANDPDYQLSKQDVLDWEATNGQIAPGSFVILFTGWEDRWNDPKAFINQDGKGNLHFPGSPATRPRGSSATGRSPAWGSTRTGSTLGSTRPTPRTRRSRRRTRSRSNAWRT